MARVYLTTKSILKQILPIYDNSVVENYGIEKFLDNKVKIK